MMEIQIINNEDLLYKEFFECEKQIQINDFGVIYDNLIRLQKLINESQNQDLNNSILLRIASIYEESINFKKVLIFEFFQNINYEMFQISNQTQMIDLISKVLYSNDSLSRVITLKIIQTLASLFSNRIDIYHQIFHLFENSQIKMELIQIVDTLIFLVKNSQKLSQAFLANFEESFNKLSFNKVNLVLKIVQHLQVDNKSSKLLTEIYLNLISYSRMQKIEYFGFIINSLINLSHISKISLEIFTQWALKMLKGYRKLQEVKWKLLLKALTNLVHNPMFFDIVRIENSDLQVLLQLTPFSLVILKQIYNYLPIFQLNIEQQLNIDDMQKICLQNDLSKYAGIIIKNECSSQLTMIHAKHIQQISQNMVDGGQTHELLKIIQKIFDLYQDKDMFSHMIYYLQNILQNLKLQNGDQESFKDISHKIINQIAILISQNKFFYVKGLFQLLFIISNIISYQNQKQIESSLKIEFASFMTQTFLIQNKGFLFTLLKKSVVFNYFHFSLFLSEQLRKHMNNRKSYQFIQKIQKICEIFTTESIHQKVTLTIKFNMWLQNQSSSSNFTNEYMNLFQKSLQTLIIIAEEPQDQYEKISLIIQQFDCLIRKYYYIDDYSINTLQKSKNLYYLILNSFKNSQQLNQEYELKSDGQIRITYLINNFQNTNLVRQMIENQHIWIPRCIFNINQKDINIKLQYKIQNQFITLQKINLNSVQGVNLDLIIQLENYNSPLQYSKIQVSIQTNEILNYQKKIIQNQIYTLKLLDNKNQYSFQALLVFPYIGQFEWIINVQIIDHQAMTVSQKQFLKEINAF